MKDRKDIDKKYTWNLDVIYSNTTEFDKDYDLVIDKINSLVFIISSLPSPSVVSLSHSSPLPTLRA